MEKLIFLCLCCVAAFASKYSENSNLKNDKMKEEAPFRMNKINLFWEKARKVGASLLSLSVSDSVRLSQPRTH